MMKPGVYTLAATKSLLRQSKTVHPWEDADLGAPRVLRAPTIPLEQLLRLWRHEVLDEERTALSMQR